MTRAIKVAAVGLGWVGQHRHLPVMNRSPNFEVIGVIDRQEERARNISNKYRYPHCEAACSLYNVPWIDEVEAITISTAPMAHYHFANEALELGKHVLTEKPFTMTLDEGSSLVSKAKKSNLCLAIVHNFQFSRSFLKLKYDIFSHSIGKIKSIDAIQFSNPSRRLPDWYDQLPFGLFFDESPHLIYLMRAIVGSLTLKRSFIIPSDDQISTPRRVEAWFTAEKMDIPIRLSCNFESSLSEWYLMVTGDKATAVVDIFRDIYISLPNDRQHLTADVLNTSIRATAQHWLQHWTSGLRHLMGRLSYGNDEIFNRFSSAVKGNIEDIGLFDANSAIDVLRLQHQIIDNHENIYA